MFLGKAWFQGAAILVALFAFLVSVGGVMHPVFAAEEPFTLTCKGKSISARRSRAPITEKEYSGSFTIDLGAMKWAWTKTPDKVRKIIRVDDNEIILGQSHDPDGRWARTEHLARKTLTYVRWIQDHLYDHRIQASCEKTELVPLQ